MKPLFHRAVEHSGILFGKKSHLWALPLLCALLLGGPHSAWALKNPFLTAPSKKEQPSAPTTDARPGAPQSDGSTTPATGESGQGAGQDDQAPSTQPFWDDSSTDTPSANHPSGTTSAGNDPARNDPTGKHLTADQPPAAPSWTTTALNRLSRLQFAIRGRMVELAQDIHQQPFGAAFWMFMLLAMAYGVFHAIGPGHGKLLTISYFMNRPGGVRTCLLFGYLTMLVHVLSATGLVFTGYYLLKASAYGTVDSLGPKLEAVSYGLIVVLGAGMTLKVLWNIVRGTGGHAHDPACMTPEGAGGLRTLLLMTVAAGLVPCPGATIVLVFSVSQGLLVAGLSAMLAISLGMGLTISLCGIITIFSRGVLLRALQGRQRLYAAIHAALALAGALCITTFGAMMYLSL